MASRNRSRRRAEHRPADTILSVEELSKRYRLGVVGTGSAKKDLTRWFARRRGGADPLRRLGTAPPPGEAGADGDHWALRNVSFSVAPGEVLGVIGHNGAGKSTLLKVLSRVTAPTSGRVRVGGRTASLLEVGTGFHPELTGRENVHLNGAILGV